MVFAEFQKHSTGWNGTDYSGPVEVTPMLGSDGAFILDSRLGESRRIESARRRIASLSAIHGNRIVGFKLYAGRSLRESTPLYGGRFYPA